MFGGSGIIGGEIIHVSDTGYFDFVVGTRMEHFVYFDPYGGCARRDCSLIHLCGYRLTLCNVYNKWEIVEILGVAHIT